MSTAPFDPRLERNLQDSTGLARRIAELERRMGQIAVTQANYPAGFVPHGKLDGNGAFSTVAPPDSTSGAAFTVPMTGVYLCRTDLTAWMSVGAAMGQAQTYIDGVSVGILNEFYYNTTGAHSMMHADWFFQTFTTTGTHYHWLRTLGNTTSDTNDRWSFVYFRVRAV